MPPHAVGFTHVGPTDEPVVKLMMVPPPSIGGMVQESPN